MLPTINFRNRPANQPCAKVCAIAFLLLVRPAVSAGQCSARLCPDTAEPDIEDATNLLQVQQSFSIGSNRTQVEHLKAAAPQAMPAGSYCRRSSLRVNTYTHYCSFHVSDKDGMGTDGVTAHANMQRIHIQGVLSLKGQCTLLISHAIQLFEKDLEGFGIVRPGTMTLDFSPDKSNKACNCYTHAAQDLGFRRLAFAEPGQPDHARKLQHSSKRHTNGFPLDCFAFPLGAAESSGLRTLWTFTDRLDRDAKNALQVDARELRSGKEKILDHAQFVIGGEPSEEPGQNPR